VLEVCDKTEIAELKLKVNYIPCLISWVSFFLLFVMVYLKNSLNQ
jgi:hypothetical protein